jgi:hypothetical protein
MQKGWWNMRLKNFNPILIAVAACVCRPGEADFRIWTDVDGKTIEAEFGGTIGDKVVLEKQDGTELEVSLDTLSMSDRKYVVLQSPPRVEIKVSARTERENEGYGGGRGGGFQIQSESVQCSVSISKDSPAPYEAPLVSEVYLIGQPEQNDLYVILDRTRSKFRFTPENKNEHRYDSGTVNLQQFEAGRQKGIEYRGYLAVVKDRGGNVLSMKCSKLAFERNAEAIMSAERGAVFDKDFKPVERSDAMDDEGRGRRKPKRKVPGRRF